MQNNEPLMRSLAKVNIQRWRQESSDGGADASDGGADYIGTRALKPDMLLESVIELCQHYLQCVAIAMKTNEEAETASLVFIYFILNLRRLLL